MGMKQSSLMGKDRVRHSSLNVEGSEFYKKARAEAIAKEEAEKKQLGSSEEVEEEEGDGDEGGEEEEEGGAEEIAGDFFEDQGWAAPPLQNTFFEDEDVGWTAPPLKNNFFEDHDEFDAQEEEEDEAEELPKVFNFNFNQVKNERPTIMRGESREAKRAFNADPTTAEED